MPKLKSRLIRCANCNRKQLDEGRGGTCFYYKCLVYPLPSYSYDKDSSFHPENCDCTDKPLPTVVVRSRKTKLPSLTF